MDNKNDDVKFMTYVFDSGMSSSYGLVAFDALLSTKDLKKTKNRIDFFYGDVASKIRNVDINLYVIRNELCSIDFMHRFTDFPFFICLYNIETYIAKSIDEELKKNCSMYFGMTEIDISISEENKRYWENLIHNLYLKNDTITFVNIGGDDDTCFCETIRNNQFKYRKVYYESKNIGQEYEKLCSIIKVKKEGKSNNLVRDIIVTNLTFNLEIRIAASLIWESIEKLALIKIINFFGEVSPHNVENAYMCLYNAAQGIERLQKVLIGYIIRNIDYRDKIEQIDELLHSHDHVKLNNYIFENYEQESTKNINKLVDSLQKFYTKSRYLDYVQETLDDKNEFVNIILSFKENSANDEDIKKYFGKCLGEYANFLYEKIKEITKNDSMNPCELEWDSKGNFVFREESNLYKTYKQNTIFKKEILYCLICNGRKYFKIEQLKPLEIDKTMVLEYINEIMNNEGYGLYDELNELYDEKCCENKEEFKKRLRMIEHFLSNN